MSKHSAVTPRRIWRVTADAPQGEYVDSRADEPKASEPRKVAGDVAEAGWLQSSLDLARGLEIIDRTDSMSSEWFDHWFGK
jgi:hypothetical protein